jgi:hypothetical protein
LGTAMTVNTFCLYRQTNILADFAQSLSRSTSTTHNFPNWLVYGTMGDRPIAKITAF